MHRLLVREGLEGAEVILPREQAKHLKVLRPKMGEAIELFDGAGHARTFEVVGEGRLRATGELQTLPPLPYHITLFASITKGSRWDWTIEKAVELGAAQIVPILSARCIVLLPTAAEREAKRERYQRIAEDAARQSHCAYIPYIYTPMDFAAAAAMMKKCRTFVGALTNPPPPPLLTALKDINNPAGRPALGLCTGPEGDFSPEEYATLLNIATPVSFGSTILRAETAAIFGLAVLAAAAQDRDFHH